MNISEHDAVGAFSAKEAHDILQTIQELKTKVDNWLRQKHPEVFARPGQ